MTDSSVLQQMYKDFFQNGIAGFHLLNSEQVIIDINNFELELLGYDRSEIVNNMRWVDLIVPEHVDLFEEHWRLLTRGNPVSNFEYEVVRKDGKHIYVLLNATAKCDEKGKIVYTRGIVVDISARKKLEYELNSNLAELDQQRQQLKIKNTELESFSYSVSHDLRAPLQTISGFVTFLKEDCSGKLNADCLDYISRIDSETKKMQRLIDDILELSRIGRQEIAREDVDFSAIARTIIDSLINTEPDRHTLIEIQDNIHAFTDPNLITIVLENLFRNAWKFTSMKEVASIQFGILQCAGETVFFIRDNGIGFKMQHATSIFEPFKRLHSDKEFAGTGIGLSIVKRIIDRHGGRIWAEAEEGKGATFFFTLQ